MMRTLLLPLLLLASAPAFADQCRHSAPRELALDLDGVKTVLFEIGHNELRVDARPGAKGMLQGRACASSEGALDRLGATQQRSGDKLVVRIAREGMAGGIFFGNNYAYMQLSVDVPDDVMVQLDVGSGDAWVAGASALSADVGSGDVEASRIKGPVTADVGSGDIVLRDIGSLRVLSIGSGDVEAEGVRGDVEVGGIGSGDFTLDRAGGRVEIGSIGSGSADISRAGGLVEVDSIGSGDVDVADSTGGLTVRSVGSGDIEHRNVSGPIDIPRKR